MEDPTCYGFDRVTQPQKDALSTARQQVCYKASSINTDFVAAAKSDDMRTGYIKKESLQVAELMSCLFECTKVSYTECHAFSYDVRDTKNHVCRFYTFDHLRPKKAVTRSLDDQATTFKDTSKQSSAQIRMVKDTLDTFKNATGTKTNIEAVQIVSGAAVSMMISSFFF
jgi:hypothetical protein